MRNKKHQRHIVGALFVLASLLAYYFHVTASFMHNPWPITDQRISSQPDARDRLFLALERDRQANEMELTKKRLEWSALVSLSLAAVFGIWYFRLRPASTTET
jgi:hypothetical protein